MFKLAQAACVTHFNCTLLPFFSPCIAFTHFWGTQDADFQCSALFQHPLEEMQKKGQLS